MANFLKIAGRWWWVWVLHGFFIALMYHFFFFRHNDWYKDSFRALGLSFEMNYAVWWSGFSLLLAALIYFRIAQLDKETRHTWNVLGLVALALCLDEIGSLHETVAYAAGWQGLLPFAAILGAGFAWSLFRLSRNRSTWLPGLLILSGVVIFAGVAGLEFIEHNVEASAVEQRLRLIVEEGSELIAMGLLITAGLVAYLRNPACTSHTGNISLSSISGVLYCGFSNPLWLFILLYANLSAVALFVIPNHSWFPFEVGEGNIAALFPVLLFTCLGLYCLHRSLDSGRAWLVPASTMLVTSLLQMYNLIRLVNSVLQENYELLRYPPNSWLVTLLPWLVVAWFVKKRTTLSWRTLCGHFAVLFVVNAFLLPGAENAILVDCYYFLLSSCIGYSCFTFLLLEYRQTRQPGQLSQQGIP